jgi:hypothetical protein
MATVTGTIKTNIVFVAKLVGAGNTENIEDPTAENAEEGGDTGGGDTGAGGGTPGGGTGGGTGGTGDGATAAADVSCRGKYGMGDDEAAGTEGEGLANPYGSGADGAARLRAVNGGRGGEAANPIDEGANNAQAVPASCKDIPKGAPDTYKLSGRFAVSNFTRCPAGSHDIGTGQTTLDPAKGYQSRGYSREEIICNLRHLAVNALEPIYNHFIPKGYKIVISSGFRRGVAKSDHTKGSAADLIFYYNNQRLNGSALTRVMKAIDQIVKVPYTQMIFETPGSSGDIIHIACRRAGGNSGMRLCWSPDNGHGARMTSGYKHKVSLEGTPPVK